MNHSKKLIFSLILFIFITIILVAISFTIDSYIEFQLVSIIKNKLGSIPVTLDIRETGIVKTDVGKFSLGSNHRPSLLIQSIQFDYSPASLFKKHVNSIMISGVELYSEYKNNRFLIQGLDLNSLFATPETGDKPSSLPFSFDRINIHNALLHFSWNKKFFLLPFEIMITPDNSHRGKYHCLLSLFFRGQKAEIKAKIDLLKSCLSMEINAQHLQAELFSDFPGIENNIFIQGATDIQGELDIRLNPLEIRSVLFSMKPHRGSVMYQNIMLKTDQRIPQNSRLKIEGKGINDWTVEAENMYIHTPYAKFKLLHFKSLITLTSQKAEGSGTLKLMLTGLNNPKNKEILLMTPIRENLSFNMTRNKSGVWDLNVKGRHSEENKKYTVKSGDLMIFLKKPSLEFSAEKTEKTFLSAFNIAIADTQIKGEGYKLKIPVLSVVGKLDGNNNKANGSFRVKASDTELSSDEFKTTIPLLSIEGKTEKAAKEGFRLESIIESRNMQIDALSYGLTFEEVNVRIPFQWPLKENEKKGEFLVKNIKWNDFWVGHLKGEIRQRENNYYSFAAYFVSAMIDRMKINIHGNTGLSLSQGFSLDVSYEAPDFKPDLKIDLSEIIPAMKNVTVDGVFSLSGNFSIAQFSPNGSLQLNVRNGKIHMSEKNFSITGIDLYLSMPDVLRFKSKPGQKLVFENLSLGDLNLSNGEIRFRTDSLQSFFIERSEFGWCSGHVFFQSMHIVQGKSEYSPVMYCDRLNLAQLLTQLGAGRAEGTGTVNGRISMNLKDTGIEFRDSFLYSTPGSGGKLRLTGTDIWTDSLPDNTQQFAQLELTKEAVKDYDYQWVKLHLKSSEDKLFFELQLDGKPSKPLPFVYDKELGGFVKVKSDQQGSNFQGIRLNVNFSLPLNEILKYTKQTGSFLK